MGPHGANLNNVVGARPGTTMIEFGYSNGQVAAAGTGPDQPEKPL